MMMALAWADPAFRPAPGDELKLWREATTIFMTSGPGGCEPNGLAVTLKRHGLAPEIFVSRPGPYFLNTVRQDDQRRVMRLAQEAFRREAEVQSIPVQLAPLAESALIETLDKDGAAMSAETYAAPSSEFDRMARFGRDELRAAVTIRKGRLQ